LLHGIRIIEVFEKPLYRERDKKGVGDTDMEQCTTTTSPDSDVKLEQESD
jgi:hypothetical protein